MRIRPVVAGDVPALVRLVNEATPGIPVDAAELETWLSDPVNDVLFVLAEDAGREPAAFAEFVATPTDARNAWLDLRIPPRNLHDSMVTALLAWGEAAAEERQRPVLRASAPTDSPLGAALCAHGYGPIRYSFRMRIDLDAPPPKAVWPEGISVRTFEPGDERAVYAAVVEAFEDGWDFTGFPYEEFEHFLLRAQDFDPTLWLIARDGDEVAGVSLCRPALPGTPGVGWVRSLAVRRPWRRRGLGLALLLGSFGAFWERGTRVVGLGVDGENTTGAVRLYEKAGMRVEHRVDLYERELG